MDNGTLIFKRDIKWCYTDAMIRLEVWSTEEGIYIQTFDMNDSILSSDLIGAVKSLQSLLLSEDKPNYIWSEIDEDGNTIWSDKALAAMSNNVINDLDRITHDIEVLRDYIEARNKSNNPLIDTRVNNTSLLNEDASVKNDCNDNDIPLEDYAEYSQTHTAHRDDGERN